MHGAIPPLPYVFLVCYLAKHYLLIRHKISVEIPEVTFNKSVEQVSSSVSLPN
jgi:hypothetical protein